MAESREGEASFYDSSKGTNPIHEGSTLLTLSYPDYFPKAPLLKAIISEGWVFI